MRVPALTCPLLPWPATAFPSSLKAATRRLREHLAHRVDACGAVREPCHSRVLESALAWPLLRELTGHKEEKQRLGAYLQRQRTVAGPVDAALAGAALAGRARSAAALAQRLVADAPDFTAPRKKALIAAVLTMLGLPHPHNAPAPGPRAFSPEGLHPWALVQFTAAKVILAPKDDRSLAPGDVALLLSTQQDGRIWEANLLIHLSVLHALARVPGHEHVVTAGLRLALRHQRADGGLPFVTDVDTWATVTTGVALASTGAPTPVLDRIAGHLTEQQKPSGGWSYTDQAALSDVDCTTVALEFLQQHDPCAHQAPIRRGTDALTALQNTDGGFPTYVAGAPSEACMTAAAINALTTQDPGHEQAIHSALEFLATCQRPDGSFPPGWSSSQLHTLFRALLATAPHPHHPAARTVTTRALDLVRSRQLPDGGFGQQEGSPSDPISTAYALICLTRQHDHVPAARATRYLLDHQLPDGSVLSVPDMLGPRPFPYTVPALASTCALLALSHLTHRL
ncbi:prenyltransferase/squalene oxidase repeat-containing protein [Streptosporangium sp. NPDC051022]|uniref:prenyltransferase/squalene oxidase repeat-containing protein n=1 Tax=Streptosporangium sp. NPDC051022 TaxID=3155752 RepID=UPI00342F5EA8